MARHGPSVVLALLVVSIQAEAADTVAVERARLWYQREIPRAEQACQAATRSLDQNEKLLERAESIARNAGSDEAGRTVALQAAARARSAIAKNSATKTIECGRLSRLKEGLGRVELSAGAAAMPIYARGSVMVAAADGWTAWDGRAPLKQGQTIKTGGDGYAEVAIPDKTGLGVVRIDANSEFSLADGGLELKRGSFQYACEVLDRVAGSAGTRVSVNGASIVMTIRDNAMVYNADFISSDAMRLSVLQGELSMQDPKAQLERAVKAGEFVVVGRDGTILEGPAFNMQRVNR